jgi:hypothetical protein
MTVTHTAASPSTIDVYWKMNLKWTLAHVTDALQKTSDADAARALVAAAKHLLVMIEYG